MSRQDATESPQTVKSVETAFRILNVIHELDNATVSKITEEMDLSKSAIYKYIKTLEKQRYIVRKGSSYRIGLRFLRFGQDALSSQAISEIAKPELESLADDTGEMANLMVEESGRGVFVHKAVGKNAVNLDTYIGKEVYLHTTALGKVILAFLPQERLDEILEEQGLPSVTENTITKRSRLEEELSDIRKSGWAFDGEERLPGLCCIAMPLLDTDDIPFGAISVSGPKNRIQPPSRNDALVKKIDAARNVIQLNALYR